MFSGKRDPIGTFSLVAFFFCDDDCFDEAESELGSILLSPAGRKDTLIKLKDLGGSLQKRNGLFDVRER